MFEVISGALLGAGGGAAWAILGSIRNFTKQGEMKVKNDKVEFNPKKFMKSIVVGAVLGGYAGSQGMVVSYDTLEALSMNAAIFTPATAIANKALGIIHNAVEWVRDWFY